MGKIAMYIMTSRRSLTAGFMSPRLNVEVPV